MNTDKEYNKFKKKIIRSIRTHLAKRVVFTMNLDGVKSTKINYQVKENRDHLILVLSHNSKIDINDANNIIKHLCSLRTFKDLNLTYKLHCDGIDMMFQYKKTDKIIRFHIFNNYYLASSKLVGYSTNKGIQYTWLDIINYEKHPDVVTVDPKRFNNIVTYLILSGIKVDTQTDWTKLLRETVSTTIIN